MGGRSGAEIDLEDAADFLWVSLVTAVVDVVVSAAPDCLFLSGSHLTAVYIGRIIALAVFVVVLVVVIESSPTEFPRFTITCLEELEEQLVASDAVSAVADDAGGPRQGLVKRFGAPRGGRGGAGRGGTTAAASSGLGGGLLGFDEDSRDEALELPLGGTGGAASTALLECVMEDVDEDVAGVVDGGIGGAGCCWWEIFRRGVASVRTESTLVHRVQSLCTSLS